MDKKMELLNAGMSDTIDILKLDEMDDIIGGDVDCKKKYAKDGISCHSRYIQRENNIRCKRRFETKADVAM